MTRFRATTLCSIAVVVAAAMTTGGWLRWTVWMIAAGAYVIVLGLGVAFIRMRFFGDAVCRGEPGRKQVALTFDDGPDPSVTPMLLGVLDELGVKATFFCVGRNVLAHPDIARKIVARGHCIANHTFEHPWWTSFLWGRALLSEIVRAQDALESVTGVRPVLFRSPMGLTNPVLDSALRKAGLVLVGWDVRSLDRRGECSSIVISRILRKVRDGGIVLLHDGQADRNRLLEIVRGVVGRLGEDGYVFVTAAAMVAERAGQRASVPPEETSPMDG
jgi:peptidoglycan/xylan/chitin deacetylase (PgdA/CDA1 family)